MLLQRREDCTPLVLQGFGGGKVCCVEKITPNLKLDEINCKAILYIVDDDILCRNGAWLVIEGRHCLLKSVSNEKKEGNRFEVNDKLRDKPKSKAIMGLKANSENEEEDRIHVNDKPKSEAITQLKANIADEVHQIWPKNTSK